MARRKSKLGAYEMVYPKNVDDTLGDMYDSAKKHHCKSAADSLVEAAFLAGKHKRLREKLDVYKAVDTYSQFCISEAKMMGLGRRPRRRR